jgi:hypothetical protein
MELASRRGFLRGAGLAAAAVTVGPVVLPLPRLLAAAGAQEAELTTPDLLAFAESIELAAAGLYGSLRPRVARPPAVAAATAFAKHHQDHGNALGPGAGDKRTGKPNPVLLRTVEDHLRAARDENEVIKVAYDLENALASTYLWFVDTADKEVSDDAMRMAASILPVEAQHAVVWGRLLERSTKDLTAPDPGAKGFESEARRLDTAQFPTVITTSTTAAAGE